MSTRGLPTKPFIYPRLHQQYQICTCTKFHASDLLLLSSISRPRWLISVDEGETSIGLIEMCIMFSSSNSNDQKCFIPNHFRLVWIISFGLAIGAFLLLSLTILLLVTSQYTQTTIAEYGRLTGFIAMTFLCLSTVLFPIGFDSEIIGGSPFQLPSDYQIGSSYILFVGATWLTVISTLISGKICLPTFII
ncbi:unnamed protein product [Rotaria sp. Silwood1]|nr:unnamed protein product [Rotaria sp. Silwood1]CAF1410826.1 unnamed protein product [Rotaria sp. Silwood1]CAF1665138.1 unnamed protein product [Rotaria sp. Silwood1]CAF1665221.1 unnamed protein product [Rotaria sp. Silwood1]CAF3571570.1 unnamed protein product [Rotaria sp. Silwood1]